MDNFEWATGYWPSASASIYVDFATQKRTPKTSAAWYRETARSNSVA